MRGDWTRINSDRDLPKLGERVLIFCPDVANLAHRVRIGRLTTGNHWRSGNAFIAKKHVTMWHPLPEEPPP